MGQQIIFTGSKMIQTSIPTSETKTNNGNAMMTKSHRRHPPRAVSAAGPSPTAVVATAFAPVAVPAAGVPAAAAPGGGGGGPGMPPGGVAAAPAAAAPAAAGSVSAAAKEARSAAESVVAGGIKGTGVTSLLPSGRGGSCVQSCH